MPGEEVWLVGERRASGERKFHLSNLPVGTSLRALAATIEARWICEQAHQQSKEELGLDHFEGRSWAGLHRHALMTMIAYAFLQAQRLAATKGGNAPQDLRLSPASPPSGAPCSSFCSAHTAADAHIAAEASPSGPDTFRQRSASKFAWLSMLPPVSHTSTTSTAWAKLHRFKEDPALRVGNRSVFLATLRLCRSLSASILSGLQSCHSAFGQIRTRLACRFTPPGFPPPAPAFPTSPHRRAASHRPPWHRLAPAPTRHRESASVSPR